MREEAVVRVGGGRRALSLSLGRVLVARGLELAEDELFAGPAWRLTANDEPTTSGSQRSHASPNQRAQRYCSARWHGQTPPPNPNRPNSAGRHHQPAKLLQTLPV